MLGYHHPPGADTPLEQTLPGADTPLPLSTHPPEQTPPGADPPPGTEHAGRYGQCTRGTHPTGMQSCNSYVYAFLEIYFCI